MSKLHEKATAGNVKAVSSLLDEGCDIDATDAKGLTALHHAAFRGHLNVVKLLCDSGADVNRGNTKGYSPLMAAAREGRVEIVQTLLASNAMVNSADDEGFTALIMAASHSPNPEVVTILIENGAELDHQTAFGASALLSAAWYGVTKNAELLVQAGADRDLADSQDSQGRVPLDVAKARGHMKVVPLLET